MKQVATHLRVSKSQTSHREHDLRRSQHDILWNLQQASHCCSRSVLVHGRIELMKWKEKWNNGQLLLLYRLRNLIRVNFQIRLHACQILQLLLFKKEDSEKAIVRLKV